MKRINFLMGRSKELAKENKELKLTSFDLRKSLLKSKVDNDVLHEMWAETISENIMITLKIELAESKAKGITHDRDDLQAEHDTVMVALERLCKENDKLKGDLKNCNDRMERYRKRNIQLTCVVKDVERALRGSIR